MKNLTPEKMRCAIGTCPSVHELEEGMLLIVGKAGTFPARDMGIEVGGDEYAVVIDRKLLANVPRDEPISESEM